MRNFLLTRIAVTLLLIVSLTIQPVVACLASVTCAAGRSEAAALSCHGCGCCEVVGADDRRCCCSGSAQVLSKGAAEPGCCRHEYKEAQESDSSREVDEASATSIAPLESGLRAICLCEQSSPPLGDSSHRQPTSENRDALSLACNLDDAVLGRDHLRAASRYVTSVLPTHRFSQVMLCIWRL